MASKLQCLRRTLYNTTTAPQYLSRQFPNATQASLALLRCRFFSDVSSQPASIIDPSSSPPSNKPPLHSTTNGNEKIKRISSPSSLNELELAKFSAIAETWWDAEGPFKPLHVMNPTRLAFIRSTLCRHFRKDPHCARPFEGLKIVDVGCGGGILSEPLARMGATVTGIDAVEKNIKIARVHAELDPLTSTIEYCCTTAEKLVEEERQFDAVIALEVIEHVADPSEFCKSLAALTISNGATVISTINRSMRAYATAIIAAEYLLHWVQEMAGFVYNPLTGRWALSDDISVNFIAFGAKNSQQHDEKFL